MGSIPIGGIFCFNQIFIQVIKRLSQLAGFEPTRAEPIGFQVQRLNHSATTAQIPSPYLLIWLRLIWALSPHIFFFQLTFVVMSKTMSLTQCIAMFEGGGVKRWDRPWQDSNLQSPDPKSGALSIRPQGLTVVSLGKLEPVSSRCCNAVGKLHIRLSSPIRYYQMALIEYII